MSVIYVNLVGFPEYFPVYSIQADGQLVLMTESSYETLGEIIPALYYENDASKVIIEGAKMYADEIANVIRESHTSKYENHKPIEIEVI